MGAIDYSICSPSIHTDMSKRRLNTSWEDDLGESLWSDRKFRRLAERETFLSLSTRFEVAAGSVLFVLFF